MRGSSPGWAKMAAQVQVATWTPAPPARSRALADGPASPPTRPASLLGCPYCLREPILLRFVPGNYHFLCYFCLDNSIVNLALCLARF